MSKVVCLFTVVALAVLACAPDSASAGLVLKDTFEDDTVGLPPNGPEIGSATYGGGAVYQVVGIDGGGKLLYSTDDSGTDLSTDCIPSSAPAEAEISCRFMIQSGSTLVDNNTSDHLLQWDNNAEALALWWAANGNLYLQQVSEYIPCRRHTCDRLRLVHRHLL